MQIKVLSVEKSTGTTSKGTSYGILEVTYKDIAGNKTASKKVMSFGSKEVFETLANASSGATYEITTTKNDKTGYWDWTAIGHSTNVGTSTASTPTKVSTYETPEERAKKQIYIIKQSSLTAALKFAEINGGLMETSTEDAKSFVLSLAQELTDWVLESKKVESFKDIPDDL